MKAPYLEREGFLSVDPRLSLSIVVEDDQDQAVVVEYGDAFGLVGADATRQLFL